MEAFHQKVAFSEYFTSILGEPLPSYTNYNSSINPTIANVFSTAAFRFGHATVSPFVNRLDENWEQHPEFPSFLLHKAFFSPWRIVDEGGFEYGGKVRPCLCTCPFVPVCPFVPENQPKRDQGQF